MSSTAPSPFPDRPPVPPVVPRAVGGRHRFPDAVAAELRRRRAGILARAQGRVLDLAEPAARAELVSASAGLVAGRYDTVVSVAELTRYPDLMVAARGLAALLAPGGWIELVEPVHHVGLARRLAATAWSGHPAVLGRFVERDVVETAWEAGFTLASLERFTMPTLVWPLRRFVYARGRIVPAMSEPQAPAVSATSVQGESR